MSEFVKVGGLRVAAPLYDLIKDEIAPGTGVAPDRFWQALGDLVHDLGAKNRALLQTRDDLQAQIDTWYKEHQGSWNLEAYTACGAG
jgi:malate synthase